LPSCDVHRLMKGSRCLIDLALRESLDLLYA